MGMHAFIEKISNSPINICISMALQPAGSQLAGRPQRLRLGTVRQAFRRFQNVSVGHLGIPLLDVVFSPPDG